MLKIHFIIQNIFIRLYSRFRISAMQLSKCCNATEVASQDTLHYRYLDNIRMDATLNISRLYDLGLLMSKNSTAKPSTLTVLSLMDNNISTVVYDANCIIDIATVIRLQGTPFCKDPYSDDGRRCFCAQSCFNSVPMQETKRKVTIIAVVVSVTSSLILMISLAILFHRNKKLKQYQLLVQQKFEEFEVKPKLWCCRVKVNPNVPTRAWTHAHMAISFLALPERAPGRERGGEGKSGSAAQICWFESWFVRLVVALPGEGERERNSDCAALPPPPPRISVYFPFFFNFNSTLPLSLPCLPNLTGSFSLSLSLYYLLVSLSLCVCVCGFYAHFGTTHHSIALIFLFSLSLSLIWRDVQRFSDLRDSRWGWTAVIGCLRFQWIANLDRVCCGFVNLGG
nr:uncharacterized protein LOC112278078 isoform X1 [Physcomitrium patens]|eukprot:XP_024366893.1 uncharacterized protein LOC112278078 isoform X1 [Physcomitrella patens]